MRDTRGISWFVAWMVLTAHGWTQIPVPTDAPGPLPARQSGTLFHLPAGFRMELVAAEPLVREPSGLCWDEKGQLYVCELHGYNLEGQYDIEELNKTGQLDRVVRRIQANEAAKQAAEAETYGTIKRLWDENGDGCMDRAAVWADQLPPCLGIFPTQGGIVAACQTQVVFLADRDGDGQAEHREVWLEGFAKGPLERSINCPQWGPDNWIYFGCGEDGGTIRGARLAEAVSLPRTDFRLRPDGTAVEPVVGATSTMGFAFTESGDRFVISTRGPGIFVAPIDWRYLARNPDMVSPDLQELATSEQRVYPTSQPHPWRTRRADDPGFSKYYASHYGQEEAAASGFFTSACAPLVYQDSALPGLRGQLLACEPAQNLVHRAVIARSGSRLTLHRAPGEDQSEFLTSSDPWFHAIALAHGPNGDIYVVDFYREIIEDYSAIPRYLQQQYGLVDGREHGRIWRLTHELQSCGSGGTSDQPVRRGVDMSQLAADELAAEVGSERWWRRETARRLLIERRLTSVAPRLATMVRQAGDTAVVLNALRTLDGLDTVALDEIEVAFRHSDPAVRRQGLRMAERWFREAAKQGDVVAQRQTLRDWTRRLAADPEPMVRLQLALTLGEVNDTASLEELAGLARCFADEPWMTPAIMTSVAGRTAGMLAILLRDPGELGKTETLIASLCTAMGHRQRDDQWSQALTRILELKDPHLLRACLRGLRVAFPQPTAVVLADVQRDALKALAEGAKGDVQREAVSLVRLMMLETPAEREQRVAQAQQDVVDLAQPLSARLSAVAQLADDPDPAMADNLLALMPTSVPAVRDALLDAVFSRRQRLPRLLDALEAGSISPGLLTAVQHATLLDNPDASIRARAAGLLRTTDTISESLLTAYTRALTEPRDMDRGRQVFQQHCAGCHQAHGLGHAVGPDLIAEFQRAEETIIRDVLAPSLVISPGYTLYSLVTTSGLVHQGLLAAESPTSLTLRQVEGKQQSVLRAEVDELRAMPVSMMPDNLAQAVSPRDLASALAWLRRPPSSLVLWDENPQFVTLLAEGSGSAEAAWDDPFTGSLSLRVTPPQRYAARIDGWQFRIREHPGPGEYRYLQFAWKAPAAQGAMIELAADGAWPPAGQAARRYHAGRNTTAWQSREVSAVAPEEWTQVTCDLWQDCGDFTLTGIAPTAIGGAVLFDHIVLTQTVPSSSLVPPRQTGRFDSRPTPQ